MDLVKLTDMIKGLRDTAESEWSELGYPDSHSVFGMRDLFSAVTDGREAFSDEHKRMTADEFDRYTRGKCMWQVASHSNHEYCSREVHTYESTGSFEDRSFCAEHLQEIHDDYPYHLGYTFPGVRY